MRERAAIFGGKVEIAGIPGKGTTVIVRMPIHELLHGNRGAGAGPAVL
jgi:nitrate/nitrite-specific signal transduction histidine kinase